MLKLNGCVSPTSCSPLPPLDLELPACALSAEVPDDKPELLAEELLLRDDDDPDELAEDGER